jgi:hypothetical protein
MAGQLNTVFAAGNSGKGILAELWSFHSILEIQTGHINKILISSAAGGSSFSVAGLDLSKNNTKQHDTNNTTRKHICLAGSNTDERTA